MLFLSFKKGDRASPNNYRPISLTCLCCKILEHIIQSNIYTHLTRHQVFCDEQHGFRAQRSCESQLTLTIDDFATCLNNKILFMPYSWIFPRPLTRYRTKNFVINSHYMELGVLFWDG